MRFVNYYRPVNQLQALGGCCLGGPAATPSPVETFASPQDYVAAVDAYNKYLEGIRAGATLTADQEKALQDLQAKINTFDAVVLAEPDSAAASETQKLIQQYSAAKPTATLSPNTSKLAKKTPAWVWWMMGVLLLALAGGVVWYMAKKRK